MVERLHVGRLHTKKALNDPFLCYADSNEGLRLQPPVPSGSQRSVDKGKGPKVLGEL